ncbi:SusC/RagA family TonB-linked outer membrane protein [Halalkalibaculum sp. DA384]|uniref:SusC/RagA family TonB-linked outer membrane protein n=1 Tax=Halalkalibaculum sp. DA384 TaxID=3373606 RepID=UPI003754779A
MKQRNSCGTMWLEKFISEYALRSILFLLLGTLVTLATNNYTVAFQVNQAETVSGIVTDAETGEPLPGVNIIVKGTTIGTTTNTEGKYSFDVPSLNDTLVVSFVGYQTEEIAINGRQTINISLTQTTVGSEELVVVGYGTQEKVNLTGSIGTVSSEQIENRSISSVEEALQGEVAGLKVLRTTGQPGNQNIDLQIRGTSTFSNNPVLVLVDGVPSSLDRVNPNDISNISVLKDAASTAIYGSRATGGVILVETKSGQSGDLEVNINSSIGVQRPSRYPEKVSALNHALLSNEARANDGNSPKYSQEQIDRFSSPDWEDNVWDDFLLRDALQTDHNISISGGSESHSYYMSVGYLKQDGIVINSDYERINIQLNQNFQLTDQLNISFKAGYIPSDRTAPIGLGNILTSVHRQNNIDAYKTSDGRWLANSTGTGGFNPTGNALARGSEDGGEEVFESNRITANVNVDYEIFPNLELTGTYGLEINNNKLNEFEKRLTLYQQDNPDQVAATSESNFYRVNNSDDILQTTSLIANYQNTINENHNFSVLAGGTAEWFEQENDFVETRDFITELRAISAGTGNTTLWNISGGAGDWALASLISRVNYSFDDKYLFEGSFRYDGSSRFAEDIRWGFFPAVSAGWVVSQENFIEDSDVLTYLKIRGSWGQVGNQNVAGFYPYINTLSQDVYFFGGSPQRAVATAGGANPDLTWETKETFNLGIEASLFGPLFEFELDLFKERTEDILLQLPLPTTFGQPEPVQNAGIVDNRGWELRIQHRNNFEDFSYGISFNISDATNEVVDMGGISPVIQGNTITEVGHSMNDWYGLLVDGTVNENNENSFFQSDQEVENSATVSPQVSPGDIKYQDINGDGAINSEDRVRLDRSDQRFPYGIRINLNYKNFDFTAFGQGVMFNKVWSNGWTAQIFDREISTLRTFHLDRWTPDNRDAKFPKPRMGSGSSDDGINDRFSSFWLEDASYFRVKNIEVGYSIPSDIMSRMNLKRARVYVSGENLFTFTDYLGYDPEQPTGTGSRLLESRYPLAKVFSFGINLNF